MTRHAAVVLTFVLVAIGAVARQVHGAIDDCAPGNPPTPEAEMFGPADARL